MIHEERDLRADPRLTASTKNLFDSPSASAMKEAALAGRGSSLSIHSTSMRPNSGGGRTSPLPNRQLTIQMLSPEDRKKLIYSNYEYLLELENARCP